MESKQSYYIKMNKILDEIQLSRSGDELYQLLMEYTSTDGEVRKLFDCDDKDNPNEKLNQIHDNLEDGIQSYAEDITTIRNSIDSGSDEFDENTINDYDSEWGVLVIRSNAINSLIVYRNGIDDKYWK